jgi:hypothetical protein
VCLAGTFQSTHSHPGASFFSDNRKSGPERIDRLGTNSDNTPDEEAREESGDPAFDFWSAEGARRFNEMLDEGSAYLSTGVRLSEDFESDLEDEPCEYFDPELCDPDEETLPPGEMELIFENSFIM